MAHPFVHVELNSTNLPKSKAFYKKLFKWKLTDVKSLGENYTMIDVGRGTGGGMLRQKMPKTPSLWMPYVLVDDIEKFTRQAEKLGATVCKDVSEVEGMGWLSILEDPSGAVFGLWQPRRRRRPR